MKKYHFITLIIAMLVLNLSCSKNEEPDNFLKGLMDGYVFNATSHITANKPEGSADQTLRITAQWPFYSIKLMLLQEGTLKKGVYILSQGSQRSATLSHNNTGQYYAGGGGFFYIGPFIGSGSITITEISKKYVKGSFEFVGENTGLGTSKTITNGEFSIARN